MQCSAATVWWRYWLKQGEGEVELVIVNVVVHDMKSGKYMCRDAECHSKQSERDSHLRIKGVLSD